MCIASLAVSLFAYWTRGQSLNPKSSISNKTKYEEILFHRIIQSRLLEKAMRVNKISMKKFSKNLTYGIKFKLYTHV